MTLDLRGIYEHKLDDKHRLSIPKLFRDQLGEEKIVPYNLGKTEIYLFPKSIVTKKIEVASQELAEMKMPFEKGYDVVKARSLAGVLSLREEPIDKLGRIQLRLASYQNEIIGRGDKVCIAGLQDYLLIYLGGLDAFHSS